MNAHHFSGGNSTEGPIGFCAVVNAQTRGRAVELLHEKLKEFEYEFPLIENAVMDQQEGVDYICVYFGRGITDGHIDHDGPIETQEGLI